VPHPRRAVKWSVFHHGNAAAPMYAGSRKTDVGAIAGVGLAGALFGGSLFF